MSSPTLTRWIREYYARRVQRVRRVFPSGHPSRELFEAGYFAVARQLGVNTKTSILQIGGTGTPTAPSFETDSAAKVPSLIINAGTGISSTTTVAPPSASSGSATTEVHGAPTTRFGINAAQIGSSEATFGSLDAIVADAAALAAGITIRQPGNADLLLPYMFPGDKSADEDPTTKLPAKEDISTQWDPTVKSNLQDLLLSSWTNGIRIRLTLGTLGAGGQRTDVGSTIKNAIAVTWTDDALTYFDTQNSTHREWMTAYATSACELLLELEANIQATDAAFALESVIDAIEVFNEIDTCNVIISDTLNYAYGEDAWTASGQAWAEVIEPMAKVISDYFGRTTKSGPRIRACLPSISSYDVDEDLLESTTSAAHAQDDPQYVNTWTWRIRFLEAFLDRFVALAEDDGITDSYTALELAMAIDYHWYHRNRQINDSDVGPLHISRLTWECQRIRAALDDVGLTRTEVTVFETGTSALTADSVAVDIYVPDDAASADASTSAQEVYQAYEVWRRLCGAAAGGAAVLGWHSYQSSRTKSSSYYGHGLRDDSAAKSIIAYPRLGYFMYQVFAEIFAAYSSCTMVLPSSMAEAKPAPVNRTSPSTEVYRDSVVFEFYNVLSADYTWNEYIYVCILDRWRSSSEGWPMAMSASGEPFAMTFCVIDSQTDAVTKTAASGSGSFPGGTSDITVEGHFVVIEEIPAVTVLLVPNNGDVAVIRTNTKLTWTI